MKKVININFQGRVVPIEETSYDLLKQYTDSLRIYFANEEGKDEIINDIESRISELFQERIKNGATCITDDDINAIINNIGRPQDLADADNASADSSYTNKDQESKGAYQQTAFTQSGKKLYRDANNKVLGGVCSGIAAYFNINVWIPRIIFLIPFISFFFRWGHFGPFTFPHFVSFSFSPGTLLIYIILWLVIPEATTTSEKLEMKGEKAVSYTHLRAHETGRNLVCRLLLE